MASNLDLKLICSNCFVIFSTQYSEVFVLIIFGLLHVNTYSYNIIQILLLQGLGSIFEIFGYLKTKNLVIPIIIHLLINLASWIPYLL